MNYQIPYEEIRAQVLDFMRELGMFPAKSKDEYLILDGQIHRYTIEGDKPSKKNGAYLIHADGVPNGFVQDWKNNDEKSKWIFKFPENEEAKKKREYFSSKEYREKIEAEQKKRAEDLKKKQTEASENARKKFEKISVADNSHPYLLRKQVQNHGLKIDDEYLTTPYHSNENGTPLVVPLRDIDGNITSLQFIFENGEKRFFTDAPRDNNFFSIDLDKLSEKNNVLLLCEGYATGAKIYELTGYPVVCAMNSGSIDKVAKSLLEKYTDAKIIVMADNDLQTQEKRGFNPGITAAENTCKNGHAIGYLAPPFPFNDIGTDWDDYAIRYFVDNTIRELNEGINKILLNHKRQKYLSMANNLGFMNGQNFASFCTPPEGDNWLIQDWLPSQSLVMLFAPSGSGKGFIAIDIAFSIACPYILKWHELPVAKHGAVVYLAGEGQRGLRKRAAGLASFNNIPPQQINLFFIPEALPLDDKNPELGVQKIIANIGLLAPEPSLIIIDTANRYMAGDENKTVDATAFIRACSEIMKEFPQSTVMIVHHTGQAQENQGRARGSSVFKAAMDMEYKVSKSGSLLTLEMTKSKDTEIQKPLVFKMHTVDAPGFFNSVGEQETTCVLKYDAEFSRLNASEEKPVKVSKSERFAKETYAEAAREFGTLINDEKTGGEIVALDVEQWRNVFYMKSAADNNDAKRARFSEARRILLEDKKILFKKVINNREYYCLMPTGETYEIEIINKIKERK